MGRIRGSIMDMTFRQTDTGTVVAQRRQPSETKVFSEASAPRNMRMSNVAHLWRSFSGDLRPAFEGIPDKKGRQFREFMSRNLPLNIQVFFPKDVSKLGSCVVGPYHVSTGSLNPITTTLDSSTNKAKTNISLGSGFSIDDETTIKVFTQAILLNNENGRFEDGDLITVYYAQQSTINGMPKIKMVASQVQLNLSDDETCVYDIADPTLFTTNAGNLGSSSAIVGGIAYVHTRRLGTSILASPQTFVCNNDEVLQTWGSAFALKKAVDSYGELKQRSYLTPEDIEAPVTIE